MVTVLDAGTYSLLPICPFFPAKVVQDASAARDHEFSQNLHGMLQDPDYDIRWNVPIVYTGTSPALTPAQPPAASSASSYVFLSLLFY